MNFPRKVFKQSFIFFILSALLIFNVSCTNSNSNQNTSGESNAPEKSSAPKDNVEELSALIVLPEQPEEAVWREDETHKPQQQGKKLTAVLKYGEESAGKIVALAEKNKPAAQTEIGAEDWFPAELTAQTQLSGNESLKGTVYGANDFLNAPYQNGKLIRIQDTNYFVLELTTY